MIKQRKLKVSEHGEQVVIFHWADMQASWHPELHLLHAIPNGAKLPYRGKGKRRYSPEAMRLKAEGLRAGVPDISLPFSSKGYHGLYIELKVGRNKPTDKQAWWLDQLTQQGYLALACWGADEAINVIKEYLSIEI